MAKEVVKSLDNPPEKAAQLKPGQKHHIQKHQNCGQNQNQSYRQAKLQQFHGRCLRCGSDKYTSNCPKTNLHCNRCNMPGHTGFVCFSNPHPRSQHHSHQQFSKTSSARSPTHGQSPEGNIELLLSLLSKPPLLLMMRFPSYNFVSPRTRALSIIWSSAILVLQSPSLHQTSLTAINSKYREHRSISAWLMAILCLSQGQFS